MRVWLYCFIVYIKILSYSRQSLLTKQQIRLEVTRVGRPINIVAVNHQYLLNLDIAEFLVFVSPNISSPGRNTEG